MCIALTYSEGITKCPCMYNIRGWRGINQFSKTINGSLKCYNWAFSIEFLFAGTSADGETARAGAEGCQTDGGSSDDNTGDCRRANGQQEAVGSAAFRHGESGFNFQRNDGRFVDRCAAHLGDWIAGPSEFTNNRVLAWIRDSFEKNIIRISFSRWFSWYSLLFLK